MACSMSILYDPAFGFGLAFADNKTINVQSFSQFFDILIFSHDSWYLETLRLILEKTFPYVGHSVSPKRHFGPMYIRQFQHNANIYWKAYSLVME